MGLDRVVPDGDGPVWFRAILFANNIGATIVGAGLLATGHTWPGLLALAAGLAGLWFPASLHWHRHQFYRQHPDQAPPGWQPDRWARRARRAAEAIGPGMLLSGGMLAFACLSARQLLLAVAMVAWAAAGLLLCWWSAGA